MVTTCPVNLSGKRREDVPDILLFPDAAAMQVAPDESRDNRRYRHGLAILEAKRWLRPLDRGDAAEASDPGAPSSQMLRYLSRADVVSDRAVKWGLLTNSAVWRLYWQDAVDAVQGGDYARRSERPRARQGRRLPLLGGGDVNLYSLFVERAQALVDAKGLVALLTPSGIAADKGSAEFFRAFRRRGGSAFYSTSRTRRCSSRMFTRVSN